MSRAENRRKEIWGSGPPDYFNAPAFDPILAFRRPGERTGISILRQDHEMHWPSACDNGYPREKTRRVGLAQPRTYIIQHVPYESAASASLSALLAEPKSLILCNSEAQEKCYAATPIGSRMNVNAPWLLIPGTFSRVQIHWSTARDVRIDTVEVPFHPTHFGSSTSTPGPSGLGALENSTFNDFLCTSIHLTFPAKLNSATEVRRAQRPNGLWLIPTGRQLHADGFKRSFDPATTFPDCCRGQGETFAHGIKVGRPFADPQCRAL